MDKILLVEDELPFVKLLGSKLIERGYGICVSYNGQDGLAEARSHPHALILLDILMPIMNGMDVLEKIRKNPITKSTKVILLTNLEPSDEINAQIAGDKNTTYCIKSDTRLTELYEMIDKIVGPVKKD